MQERMNIFKTLLDYDNLDIVNAVKEECFNMEASIAKELEWEKEHHRTKNETFE